MRSIGDLGAPQRLVETACRALEGALARPVTEADRHWGHMLLLASGVPLASALGRADLIDGIRARRRMIVPSIGLTGHCSTWLDLLLVAELAAADAVDDRELADARAVAEHVLRRTPRTEDALVAVTGPDGTPWAFTDTVHFVLAPIASLAPRWGEPSLAELMREQIELHVEALVINGRVAHGVRRHGGPAAGLDWARSTGYLVHGLADTVRFGVAGLSGASPAARVAEALLDELGRAQGPDGRWHLRPMERKGGPEDSGSALLLSGLLLLGRLDAESVDRGVAGLLGSIGPDDDGHPTLLAVAQEIPIEGVDDYAAVRRARFPWGTATLVRLAASLATTQVTGARLACR